jgi:hypothetical protein
MRARVMMTSRRLLLGLVFFLPLLLAACTAPVSVERVDPRTVHREIAANVLTVGEESGASRIVLYRWDLTERFRVGSRGSAGSAARRGYRRARQQRRAFRSRRAVFPACRTDRKAGVLPGSGRLCLCAAVSARRRGAALSRRPAAKGSYRSVQSRLDLRVRLG